MLGTYALIYVTNSFYFASVIIAIDTVVAFYGKFIYGSFQGTGVLLLYCFSKKVCLAST